MSMIQSPKTNKLSGPIKHARKSRIAIWTGTSGK
jgi:hypothetical protein